MQGLQALTNGGTRTRSEGFTSMRAEVLVGDMHGLFPGSLRVMQVNHSHMKPRSPLYRKLALAKTVEYLSIVRSLTFAFSRLDLFDSAAE